VVVIGSSLFVSENNNNRVLRFDNAASVTTNPTAAGVLGQANFTANDTSSINGSVLRIPRGIDADRGGRLYVCDLFRNRVLIYNNAVSKANGDAADFVLGQPGFNSITGQTDQDSIQRPSYVAVDSTNNVVHVSEDNNNHRITGFVAASALPVAVSGFSID
jgi:hypothetical protein